LPEVAERICEFGFPGPLRDQLVAAVLAGKKTATSSLLAEWERDHEPLPTVGERQTVIDSAGQPVATIEMTACIVTRLSEVDDEIAVAEGEAYTTAAGWRAEHERFWRQEVIPAWDGDTPPAINDQTFVVVMWFRLTPQA
jgi:uncharacterized protein YhfF